MPPRDFASGRIPAGAKMFGLVLYRLGGRGGRVFIMFLKLRDVTQVPSWCVSRSAVSTGRCMLG